MIHREEVHEGIHDTVRRAITEELPKALQPFLKRLTAQPPSTANAPELVSRRQAAAILGVSIQTVALMISDGTLISVRVRRRVLIPIRSIEEYLRVQDHVSKGASR